MSLHDGHRDRMRDRFLQTGFEGMEDHEALELILYYFFPRINTNPIAHRLIETFGSFYGVLSANPLDIEKVEGMGRKSAVLLSVIAESGRKYFSESKSAKRLPTLRSAAEYICPLMYGLANERFYLFCLNSNFTLVHREKVGEGSIDSVPVYTRRIAEIALRHSASYVILSHNHPGGDPRPSKKDISITLEIIGALRPLGIGICDHIIVADKAYYSFLDKGNHIHTLESRGMAVAAEDSLSYLQLMSPEEQEAEKE